MASHERMVITMRVCFVLERLAWCLGLIFYGYGLFWVGVDDGTPGMSPPGPYGFVLCLLSAACQALVRGLCGCLLGAALCFVCFPLPVHFWP
jgi:hypothetical protein